MVDGDSSAPVKMAVSFGLKRKEKAELKTVAAEVVDVTVDSDEERDIEEAQRQAKKRKLTHFEDGAAPRDKDEQKESLVIPIVVERDWRVKKLLEQEKEGTISDEDKAKLAILLGESYLAESSSTDGAAIVVDEAAVETVDADYGEVPIESFGLAILRGCGWKDGEGIGKNPQVVPLRLPNRRPKGLGLGATPQEQKKDGKKNGSNEELDGEIKKDTPIKIVDGRSHKGYYGKVQSRDDDNNSLYVRLALGGKIVKVSLFAVKQVSNSEYEKDGKCINKDDYDREKKKVDERNEMTEKNKKSADGRRDERRRDDRDYEKQRRYDDDDRERESSSELWARPDLIVRFIDKDYKRGKYFNEKMRIVDVASRKQITLEDNNGVPLCDIRQSWLETVIPRYEGEHVMIVRGKRRGQVAVMERKDKEKQRVIARITATNEVEKVHFDDVCHYKPKDEDDL